MFFGALISAIRDLTSAIQRLILSVDRNAAKTSDLVAANRFLAIEADRLSKLIGLRRPGLVWLKLIREESGMLVFVLSLPPKAAADVVSRELTVKIGAADPVTLSPSVDATETDELSGADNDNVSGSLVDIDDAGNRSEARTFEFVLTDTIPPGQPGEVGLRVTREE